MSCEAAPWRCNCLVWPPEATCQVSPARHGPIARNRSFLPLLLCCSRLSQTVKHRFLRFLGWTTFWANTTTSEGEEAIVLFKMFTTTSISAQLLPVEHAGKQVMLART